MPYFVKVGTVISGPRVYEVGEALPPGVGDAAMREAGAVEWREPVKAEKPKATPKHAAKPKAVQ
jgi:hypothetical protein